MHMFSATTKTQRRRRQWTQLCAPNLRPEALGCQSGAKSRFRSLAVLRETMLSDCPRSRGEVPERSNGAVSKTVVPLTGDRGFESLPLRQFTHNSLRYLIRERFRLPCI